jgi:phospholipid/cholesterol/gamma-HCH transport system permease protein
MSSAALPSPAQVHATPVGSTALHDRIAAVGLRAQAAAAEARGTLVFMGEVLLALARLLRGRSRMRWPDLLRQMDQTGPLSLPIVSLTCFLVGLMLAYMGGAQLTAMGASTFIADVVTVGWCARWPG